MVQATGSEWSLGLPGRVVLAGRATTFYAWKMLFPSDLAFIYPRWEVDPRILLQWLPVVGWLAALAAVWVLRERAGRGPLASLLLFGGVLFPAMGFFNVYAMRYSWVADHFAYQAVAVFAACTVTGASAFVPASGPLLRRAAAAAGVALLALLGATTFRQSRVYRGEETLWRDTLEKNPSSFMVHTNYGFWLSNNGRVEEAVEHFESSLRLRPDNVPTLLNLARIEEQRGRLEAAAVRLRAALRLDPAETAALINLGTVNAKAGRPEEARTSFEEALRIGSSGDYLAHNGLGVVLMQQGKGPEALGHFREALRLRPDYDFARANLERSLALLGAPR